MARNSPLLEKNHFVYGDDVDIKDPKEYVYTLFRDGHHDQSDIYIDFATSNSSALMVYKKTDCPDLEPNSMYIGKDEQGEDYYAVSMTYTILRELGQRNIYNGYAGIISYVPVLISKGKEIYLPPGKDWEKDTVGMMTHHNVKDKIVAPPIAELSLLDAINQVVVTLAGYSQKFHESQRFLIGYKIIEMLAKTIRYYGIKIRDCDLPDFGPLDLMKDWRKLIGVLIFGKDAPNLSNDIKSVCHGITVDLMTFYDTANVWKSELARDALITHIAIVHGNRMIGSYIYYIDTMSYLLDDLDENETHPMVRSILRHSISVLESEENANLNSNGMFDSSECLEPADPDNTIFQPPTTSDFLIEIEVSSPGTAGEIRYKEGLQPMIRLSTDQRLDVKYVNQKARIQIQDEQIILTSRSALRLAREFINRITAIKVLGNGITRGPYTKENNLMTGSMIANLALSGTFGTAAGLWVLSHIIHGDLKVSKESLTSYAKPLAVENGKLKLTFPIGSRIMKSIHTVTDGNSVYSVWHPNYIMKLTRSRGRWLATETSDIPLENVKSCQIRTKNIQIS